MTWIESRGGMPKIISLARSFKWPRTTAGMFKMANRKKLMVTRNAGTKKANGTVFQYLSKRLMGQSNIIQQMAKHGN